MQVRTKTLQLLARHVHESLSESVDLDCRIDELALDSLALFEIVYELEESFNVELDERQLAGLKTVRDLTDELERKLAAKD